MRRLLSLVVLAVLAVLLPMHAAGAGPRVGPPLHTQLYLYVNDFTDSPSRTAALDVSGTGCLPQDAPASVIVTVDRLAGQVFTAKPNAKGRWYVSIEIPTPIDGVYVVNAECDNYFGTTTYPTAQPNADQVIIVRAVADSSGGSGPPLQSGNGGGVTPTGGTANTGNQTATEFGIGLGALALGLLLLLAGRPRRAAQPVTSYAVGRHRRTD